MARLCERPGCSAPASVAYGMDGDQLLVWLEVVPDDGVPARMGVVCRRHADAMVVPRGWTLDDRRETRPRLFRVSATEIEKAPKPARRSRRGADGEPPESLQLSFGMGEEPVVIDDAIEDPLADEVTVGEIRPLGHADVDETHAIPWRFEFNQDDDLDGLLQTNSPLLSRAFRGQQRSD
ncbi:MAG: hypothetical protein ABIR32_21440 [Ilumatobacteraceae bacterium]